MITNLVRYVCDNCGKVEELRCTFTGLVKGPAGWIDVSAGDHSWTHNYCSEDCARNFHAG